MAAMVTNVFEEYGSDGAAIQQAINAVIANSSLPTTLYLQAGTWPVDAEITLPANCPTLTLIGEPHNYTGTAGTILQATASMRSVIAILSPYHQFINLKIDANQKATYCRYIQGWTWGRQSWVMLTNALFDGDFLDLTTGSGGINDAIYSNACFWVMNGTMYATANMLKQNNYYNRMSTVTGTASTTAGSSTINFTGAPDLTTLGIRTGDFIRIGADLQTALFLQIASVSSSSIDVQVAENNTPSVTLTDQDYAIGVGDGWHEEIFRDNNRNVFVDCLFRASGGSGIAMHGLYGDSVYDGLADFNGFFGIAMGSSDNQSLTDSIAIKNVYMEANQCDLFFGQVTNCTVENIDNIYQNNSIFSVIGSTPTANIIRGGTFGIIGLGVPQNFLVEVQNDNGTLQSRIVSDHWNGFDSLQAGQVIGASATWTDIPLVDATTDFANGVGILGDDTQFLMFDVASSQNMAISGSAAPEFNSTGTAYVPSVTVVSNADVNGTTINRTAICLTGLDGTPANWDTGTIPSGTTVSIRVQAYILGSATL